MHSLARFGLWGVSRWLHRYLSIELASLAATIACATLAAEAMSSPLVLALITSYGGTIAYYGLMVARERMARQRPARTILRDLALEFGGAEVLDSLLYSPLLMTLCFRLVPSLPLAVTLSELARSSAFYLTVLLAQFCQGRSNTPLRYPIRGMTACITLPTLGVN